MLSPNDPRYYDPRFDNSGEPIDYDAPEGCTECEREIPYEPHHIGGAPYCENCWVRMPRCLACECPFDGEGFYCSDSCSAIAEEEEYEKRAAHSQFGVGA